MNIFYLDTDPVLAAQMQCDKHVVKMILESAQMLCTAHRVLDGEGKGADAMGLYKTTLHLYGHVNDRLTINGCLLIWKHSWLSIHIVITVSITLVNDY